MNKLEDDKYEITQHYLELINLSNIELFKSVKPQFSKIQQIFPLLEFILNRLECVFELTTSNRIWDAEIILRSASEAFIKYLYIISDRSQFNERLDEYWNLLPEIYTLKHSEQAKKNLNIFSGSGIHKLAYSPQLLSEEDEIKLRSKWSKKSRQRIEQKWSFTELVNQLSRNYKGEKHDMFLAFLHGYRMGSHLIHGDETGVLIIKERDSRTPQEIEIAYFAHYLRLISDCLSYVSFIGVETMNFLELDKTYFIQNQKKAEKYQDKILYYHSKLFDDKMYDKYKTEEE